MKKIHLLSLAKCYEINALRENPSWEMIARLPDRIPKTGYYYVGPFFSSTYEATNEALEGFKLLAGRELKDAFNKGPFNVTLGSGGLIRLLVPPETMDNLEHFKTLEEISDSLGDKEIYLGEARKSIKALFSILPDDAECLMFMVFPFGEIICQEYLRENYTIPIFKFLKGFSLGDDGHAIRAELLP